MPHLCSKQASPKGFKCRGEYRSQKPGKLIHSDVGSYEVNSQEGYRYYITFVDDCSKFTCVFPMKFKNDVFNCFKLLRASFEKNGNYSICAFCSDNRGEYILTEFTNYLAASGICHEPGSPHSPELNGVAERTNRTISNHIRCALLQSKTPKSFWANALRHLLHSLNSFPCKTPLGFNSPLSILNHPPVNAARLHPFGCLSWYKVPEADRKKLDPKDRALIILSYLSNENGFCLWDLEKRQVVKSRDVVFQDFVFPYDTKLSLSPPPLQAKISWPSLSCGVSSPVTQSEHKSPQRTPTPDLPLLDIQLEPCFNRCLQASIHPPPVSPPPGSSIMPTAPPPSPVLIQLPPTARKTASTDSS